jgi:hypothetical protein
MTIGEVQVLSGVLLLADPMHIYDPIRIEGVPQGQVPVRAQVICYPEGGQRIAKVGFTFQPGAPEKRQALGTIGVDSAKVIAVDADVYQRHWKEVGSERIGHIGIPEHRKVARLIEKKFGLKSWQVNPITSEFEGSISEELEARIVEYLQTFPEYAEFTYMYFSVKTMNTFECIQEAMRDRLWTEVILDESSGARLLAFVSGFGDGSYPAEGLYSSQGIVGAEIELIGPAQDEILEAFPILRY